MTEQVTGKQRARRGRPARLEERAVSARSDELQEAPFEDGWMDRHITLRAFVLQGTTVLGWSNLHNRNAVNMDDPATP